MYYIYAYLRKTDDSPYYIGKGKGQRSITKRKFVSVPKDRTKIVYWHIELDEDEAFRLEEFYITLFGRKDLKEGILLNQTNGGEGASGTIRHEDVKTRISKSLAGRKKPPQSEAQKLQHSLFMKGRIPHNKGKIMTEEQKMKLRKPKRIVDKHHSLISLICPKCMKEGRGNGFKRWHFDRCNG